ncbi:MAG: RdgB/HAM1 family non-canonical purine NTP pyrophosphatase [Actinomycetaceae bacterium]|nr:RdgB/HAM1 family non-canonical purine NTP pyrophosphatase [Actinomycetaceae bacterium]
MTTPHGFGSAGSQVVSKRLALATGNPHKVQELAQILSSHWPQFDPQWVATMADYDLAEPVEDAVTFAGNALIKARALANVSGLPTIADDSGICVDVLGGAPGIFSARWCGHHGDSEANLHLLLNQLADVPAEHRGANFTCAAALVLPSGEEVVREGVVSGTLLTAPQGEGGFGYDPIFVPDGYQVTTAQLSAEEKNAISHRGKAFTALLPHLRRALQDL